MYSAFKDYPDALENTVDIAKRCNIEFDVNSYHFPKFETSDEKSVDELFEQKVRDGFNSIFQRIKIKNPDEMKSFM